MSPSPQPGLPEAPQFESARDVVPLLDKLKDLKVFWRTRQAILNGESLHELTKDELKQRELMGPLKFNIFQSAISALPSVFIAAGIRFFEKQPATPPLFENLPEFEAVYGSLEPFVIPFVLLLVSFAVGLTLNQDRSPASALRVQRRRLGRHYLYLDAAYGLYPQALAALYPTLSAAFQYPSVLMAWQAVITFRLLPSDLYARGESLDKPLQLFGSDPKTQVPWKRYLVVVLILIPAFAVGLTLICFFIALGVSAVVHWWFASGPR